jgi:hypothetical protein
VSLTPGCQVIAPIAADIMVTLNWPGTCAAMYAASTAVRWSFWNTLAEAAVITKSVSSSGGTSPLARCQVTAGVWTWLIPPIDSRMPVIQLVRRTSPSVKTRIPADRCAPRCSLPPHGLPPTAARSR